MNSADFTFIIPIRIESNDRLRNLKLSVSYLKKNLPECTIIVKEVDSSSKFPESLRSQVVHIFEKNDSPVFHRTRILNEMMSEVSTLITANYDADILLPLSSLQETHRMISEGTDVVYPYAQGNFQYQVFLDERDKFNETLNLEDLHNKRIFSSGNGHVQIFKTSSYRSGFMENENFISYGPEDEERYFRFSTLGYRVERVKDFVYHMEHERSANSSNKNPYFASNWNLFNQLRNMNSQQLTDYYHQQEYLKKYNTQ